MLIMVLKCDILGGGAIIYGNLFFFSLNVTLSLFCFLLIFKCSVLSLLNIWQKHLDIS